MKCKTLVGRMSYGEDLDKLFEKTIEEMRKEFKIEDVISFAGTNHIVMQIMYTEKAKQTGKRKATKA